MPLSAAAKFRYTLVAGTTAVVIGAAFTVTGLTQGSAETPSPTSVDVPLAAAASPDSGGGDEEPLPTPEPSLSSSATPRPSPSPSAKTSKKPAASPSPSATTKKKKTSSPKPATEETAEEQVTAASTSGTVTEQVLAHINEARVAEGLEALTLDTDLSKAAAIHNQLMIDGCGLSHQCSGESGIGDRFSAQGVKWSSAGENIGYGSSASSDAAKVKAANGLTDSMLAEVPPNDGHRKNLLSTSFTRIGLSVVRDSKGITWMTQDFVG
ncbi:CAP domain-containing protein [Actinoplanes sp. NPDC023936]|uniref:CAP domain-containing protein n=1 Tax=Actinoplanes sp. NPDC023936 TaxID=3154910 RepID=UPI0033DDEED5